MRSRDWQTRIRTVLGWNPGWKGAFFLLVLFLCYLIVMVAFVAG